MDDLPLPPDLLAARVGTPLGEPDPGGFYLREGARLRGVVEDLLPADWSWPGIRALDFGCGSARVLRHFQPEARDGAFWGADIDEASIAWDQAHLSPPFRFFRCQPTPPLPLESASLDLIWALSVFTHIGDAWSDWLLEMHRVLAPGGLLLVSFLGDGMWPALVGEPYVEDDVGMVVVNHWQGPDAWVLHSEWWLREHWGRAFDVLSIKRPPSSPTATAIEHSYLALRRRDLEPTRDLLESINPGEPREIAALSTSLRLTRRDLAITAVEQRAEGERCARAYYEQSRSWRLTAPMRRAAAWGRRLAGRWRPRRP